jgi:hypothetical protein
MCSAWNAPMDMIDQMAGWSGWSGKSVGEAYGSGYSLAQTSCLLLKAFPESVL